MKKLFSTIFILSLLIPALPVLAQKDKDEKKKYDHVKERNISKTYAASGNSLKIDNSFGDVTVTTWDKNEIKVDVHIEVSSDNEKVAEKTFNAIDVNESQNGKAIKFKTSVNKNNNNCKNCHSSMEINYTIQLPASVSLDIENSFGDIQVPDYSGPISLTSKFGSLTAGNLAKTEDLAVEFGTAKIKSTGNVDAVFKFSTISVEKLTGSSKVKIEFCGDSKIGFDNSLTALTLNESYSTLNLKPSADFSATYNIKTSFGSVKDRSNANIKRMDEPDEYGPDSDHTYEGRSGSGAAKVQIKSSFGSIIIGEASAEDMKGKDKKKKKTAEV